MERRKMADQLPLLTQPSPCDAHPSSACRALDIPGEFLPAGSIAGHSLRALGETFAPFAVKSF
jgi:hypothetical protein